jgi:hypothetical protein
VRFALPKIHQQLVAALGGFEPPEAVRVDHLTDQPQFLGGGHLRQRDFALGMDDEAGLLLHALQRNARMQGDDAHRPARPLEIENAEIGDDETGPCTPHRARLTAAILIAAAADEIDLGDDRARIMPADVIAERLAAPQVVRNAARTDELRLRPGPGTDHRNVGSAVLVELDRADPDLQLAVGDEMEHLLPAQIHPPRGGQRPLVDQRLGVHVAIGRGPRTRGQEEVRDMQRLGEARREIRQDRRADADGVAAELPGHAADQELFERVVGHRHCSRIHAENHSESVARFWYSSTAGRSKR